MPPSRAQSPPRQAGWFHVLSCAPSILTLAVPIVAGLATSGLMGVVDSAVVAPLGNVALGAVSLASSVTLIFVAALYGLLSPVGILAARALGAADASGVTAQRRAGWRLALVAGGGAAALMAAALPVLPHLGQPAAVIDALAPYWMCSALALVPFALLLVEKQALDAIERPWLCVGVNLAAVALNAVLSLWFVRGGLGIPAIGLLGAGLGTIAAYSAAVIMYLALGRTVPGLRRWLRHGEPGGWRAELALQRAEGVPMGLQYLLETGATALAGVLVGLFGAVALAANQITMSVAMIVYMAPLGVAAAAGIRLSQAIGADNTTSLWPPHGSWPSQSDWGRQASGQGSASDSLSLPRR